MKTHNFPLREANVKLTFDEKSRREGEQQQKQQSGQKLHDFQVGISAFSFSVAPEHCLPPSAFRYYYCHACAQHRLVSVGDGKFGSFQRVDSLGSAPLKEPDLFLMITYSFKMYLNVAKIFI